MQAFDIKMPTRPELLSIEIEARRERSRVLGAGFRIAMQALRDIPARLAGRPTPDGRLA